MVSVSGKVPKFASNNGGGTPPPSINVSTAPANNRGINPIVAAALYSHYLVQKKPVCEHHKKSLSDPELPLFISELQKAWNLI